jgi:SAM-dependent methyltransferase
LLIAALLAGSELAWAYLALAWYSRLPATAFARTALSWPAAALLLALAVATARRLLRSRWAERRAALGTLVTGALLVPTVVWLEYGHRLPRGTDLLHLPDRLAHAPAAASAMLFGAFLWWRGVAVARSPLHFDDAYERLVLGVAALIAVLVLSAATGAAPDHAVTAALVLQFFTCILPALALTRLADIRRQRVGDAAGPTLGREWLTVLGLTVAGILTLAVLVAGTVSADVARALTVVLDAGSALLIVLVYAVALPMGLVATVLIWVLRGLIALLGGSRPAPPQPLPSPDEFRQQASAAAHHLPPVLLLAGKWLILGLVVAVIAAVIVRAVFRYRRDPDEGYQEVRESLWPGGGLLTVIGQWLRRLVARLGGRWRRSATRATAPVSAAATVDPEARTLRAMYRAWLTAAARRGRPRRPAQTPAEFLAETRDLVPDRVAELAALTRSYEVARYGAPPLPPAVMAEAQAAWSRLRDRLAAFPSGAAKQGREDGCGTG